MGLSCSFLAPKGSLSDDLSKGPKKQGRDANSLPKKDQDGTRSDASAVRPAPPSVVVPWVLQQVAESVSETDDFRRSVILEKHAARLRLCWTEYGSDFLKTFAAEVVKFPGAEFWKTEPDSADGTAGLNEKSQLLTFLLNTFAAEHEYTAKLRIKRGSIELWHATMGEFERVSVFKGPDWTSPEKAQIRSNTRQLLVDLEAAGATGHFWTFPSMIAQVYSYSPDTYYTSENARYLLAEMRKVKEKIAGVEKDAAKVVLEAKKQPIKASLKPAPWEVD